MTWIEEASGGKEKEKEEEEAEEEEEEVEEDAEEANVYRCTIEQWDDTRPHRPGC